MLGKGRVAVGALVFITGVVFGYSIALHRSRGRATVPAATKTLAVWTATLKLPSSIQLPEKDPVLKLEFTRDRMASLSLYDEFKATVTNLTDQPYVVTCAIYGYNTKGNLVSEHFHEFDIGRHESVIRQIMVDPQLRASSLRLSVQLGQ